MEDRLNIVTIDGYSIGMTPQNHRRFFANENGDPLHAAFDQKTGVHPQASCRPVSSERIGEIWAKSMAQEAEKEERAAYFHIPFCQTHCLYCGFYLNPFTSGEEENRYVDYLIRELEMVSDATFIKSHPFHAVYLGGGTPTALSPNNLSRLLEGIKQYLLLANDCEFTVEGRTHNFSDDKIFACIQGGVNRFSLGVQSFDTHVRRKVGRIETGEEVSERLKYLKGLGETVVGIDLIYGLPYQTLEIWESDVKRSIELGLDGVCLYQLDIFEKGKLQEAVEKQLIAPPAGIRMQADMFARGVDIMKRAGYRRLSMPHWGRTTRERSLYNTLARSGRVCVPFGSGAGGWMNGYFFMQDRKLDDYYRKIDAGNKPIAMCMKQAEHNDLFREIVGQMELGHCHLRALGERYGFELEEIYLPILEQWENVGLIQRENGSINLTLAGQFWEVNLSQNLIDYFTEVIEGPSAGHGMVAPGDRS
ncbi:heme anaerobic degradation radical SAM methyltransferase ChuW/HutW [Dehalococcoidales bacterium]|nr:heme anaerobic degradation radical SAM methyltransferase ChuW/HutW [Dehalococcoidales bacterium]